MQDRVIETTRSRFAAGLSNAHATTAGALPVEGAFPTWLSGTLIRNGPGQFDVGATSYRHWFDGLAMLHAFTIANGAVSYAGRFLDTPAHRADNENGKINFRGFATDPCRSIFKRAMSLFTPQPDGLNTNVNITRLADEYIAMTETPMAIAFDPRTLATRGEFRYDDGANGIPRLEGNVTTAHPHYDPMRRLGYNYLLKFGATPTFQIHSIDGKARKWVGSVPSKTPAYVHSFGMTENYVILAEFSFVLPSALSIVFGDKPFIDNYRWQPEQGARFHLVDKATGKVRTVETDAFFAFHHINAYERATDSGGEIVLDVSAYPDASLIETLMLKRLRAPDASVEMGRLRRYRIPLQGGGRASYEIIGADTLELPRIHYSAHNGKAYRYAYGAGTQPTRRDFFSQLVKIDVESGETWTWSAPDAYPGEPVFIPTPDAQNEDDGVLLSVVLDAAAGHSYLVVLDARTMNEIACASAPVAVPFGFHGQWFS
ncbi:MAG: carotenoid oxygenase family protein [Chloroflexota bacterium]|nr:carotenoid oxygenase family protein [Chloroflexota bacterium]